MTFYVGDLVKEKGYNPPDVFLLLSRHPNRLEAQGFQLFTVYNLSRSKIQERWISSSSYEIIVRVDNSDNESTIAR